MALTREEGLPGESVILFMHVRDADNKNLVDPYSVGDVLIHSVDPDKVLDPGTPLLTLTPEKLGVGTFFVTFNIPASWCPGRFYDKWGEVVINNGQLPLSVTQTFIVRPRAVVLGLESPSLGEEESPRVTLLTKEMAAGEIKKIRFVLSRPTNMPLPPTEIRIHQEGQVVLEWTEVVRDGNEGYLLVNLPEETRPGILRAQFRLTYGNKKYITPVNDLRLMAP